MLKIIRWFECHKQINTHTDLIRKAVGDSGLDPVAVVRTMELLKYKTPSVRPLVGSKLISAVTDDLCRYARDDLGKYAFLIDELIANLYISEECPMKLYHRIAVAVRAGWL